MDDIHQSVVDQVIAAFGNVSGLAKALGHKHVTTVHGWKQKQKIPDWRRREIIDAAQRLNKTLPAAFVNENAEQPVRKTA